MSSGVFHGGRFDKPVLVPSDSLVDEQRKEGVSGLFSKEFFFQMTVGVAGKIGSEIHSEKSAQKPWVASITQNGHVITAKEEFVSRFDMVKFFVESADGNFIAASKRFKFGDVEFAALRKFFNDSKATFFQNVKFGSSCASVFETVGFDNGRDGDGRKKNRRK